MSLMFFDPTENRGMYLDPAGVSSYWDDDFDVSSFANSIRGAPQETVGNADSDTIFRLREGIERFLITDINNAGASAKAQSTVFIMWDQVSSAPEGYNHIPGGSNVLFMDGHVEFEKYPGKAPVTRSKAYLSACLQRTG